MRRFKIVKSSLRRLVMENLEIRSLMAADFMAGDFMAGELVIQYEAGLAPGLMATNQQRGVEVLQEIDPVGRDSAMVARLRVPAGKDVMAMAQEYQKLPGVLSAEPNWILKKAAVSNDPSYTSGQLWGTYSNDSPTAFGGSGTTNTFGSGAEEAWGNGYIGSSQVVVAVIDEGIDVSHPDLQQNIWVNPGEVANDGIDNDGNGRIDDVNGWDFFNNDKTVYDGGSGDTHGTHVAGTIGAVGGNGIGVAGVSWDVKMISAKFLGPTGGSITAAIQAIDYLTALKVNQGVNIVAMNNSWGGGGYSTALHAAIIRAANAGILFVAAAGNSSLNNDASANYPSNYSTLIGVSGTPAASYESVIAVASTTSTGGLSSFSNYGATQVDIGAPGSSILSTLPGNTYGTYSGTSMATPHVTGAVAVLAAAKPGASAASIRDAILSSAVPTTSLAGKTVPKLTIANASRLEGNSGTSLLSFAVSLSAPATEAFSVAYATSNGTASAGSDYTAVSSSLSFAPGETSKTISVEIAGDTTIEAHETFFVDLGSPSNGSVQLLTGRATGTITNDDSVQLSIDNVSASESAGTFVFTVSLNAPSTSSVSVRFATANGTARAGKSADYTATSGTLSFSPGQTTRTFSVNVRNDTTVEANETFFVNLSSALGAVISDSQGIGTILDDDGTGANRFFSGGSPDSLSASDWLDVLEDRNRRRGLRR
jgi:subtilisin family serine protease